MVGAQGGCDLWATTQIQIHVPSSDVHHRGQAMCHGCLPHKFKEKQETPKAQPKGNGPKQENKLISTNHSK